MPIAIPSLAITDNADGTVTATLSGGNAGATNAIYSQVADGNLATPAWTSRGSRTGDGVVTFSLGRGVYWFRNLTTLATESYDSPLVSAGITDGIAAMHERIVLAIKSRIQSLTLAGTAESPQDLPAPQVYDQLVPNPDPVIFPAVLVTIEGEAEQVVVEVNTRDDWSYPTRVSICDRSAADYKAARGKYLKWREQIALAFSSQRLPGVPEVFQCSITPAVIVDPNLLMFQYLVSGLTLRHLVRQPRGLT